MDNYGMYAADDKVQLTYVQCGILGAILLNSGAADFVVTGCGTGEGAMLAMNSFPGVICGHVEDPVDAYTFAHVNDGNAVAMPFAKGFGWGGELNLEYVFEKLFGFGHGQGYPPERVEYMIPFERNEYSKEDRISYCPGSFSGSSHYITMRKARPEENRNFRNLAKNVMDQHEDVGCYPHVHANAETKGPIGPLFAARNVIDGVLANACHYPWPFQSWGIDQREDVEITVEFGRPVDADDPSPFPALTQIEVFGKNAE